MGLDQMIFESIAANTPRNLDLIDWSLYLAAFALVTEIVKLRHKQ